MALKLCNMILFQLVYFCLCCFVWCGFINFVFLPPFLFCAFLSPGKYEAGFLLTKYGGGRPVGNGVGSSGLYQLFSINYLCFINVRHSFIIGSNYASVIYRCRCLLLSICLVSSVRCFPGMHK